MTARVTERVAVRVKPGASRTRVGGRYDGPYGQALIVAVTARPVEGQANEAVRRVLAEALGVRRSQLTIVSGESARDKVVAVTQPPPGLSDRLAELIEGSGR